MLTDRIIWKIRAKDRDFKLFDSGGLFLLFRSTGHPGWRFKYRINGHEKLLSFGPVSDGFPGKGSPAAKTREGTAARRYRSQPQTPGWRADAIERQLAHGERDHVRAVYNHAEYLPERKLMMQHW